MTDVMSCLRQMLLPLIVLWQMLCHVCLADVIANYVEDVTPHVSMDVKFKLHLLVNNVTFVMQK